MPQNLKGFAEEILERHGPHPFSASIELTGRCNLNCVHCYMCSYRQEEEMSTREVVDILDQLADAGCLSLLITGGEPLLLDDFPYIWRAAKERGFVMQLFTNATLVTKEIEKLLYEFPPVLIEVSLYGATPGSYEAVTGSCDAYYQAIEGISQLSRGPGAIHLKAPVLKQNKKDLAAMAALAKKMNILLYHDTEVFDRLDLSTSPRLHAVAIDENIDDMVFDDFHREILKQGATEPSSLPDRVITCRGGEMNFHIGPYGDLCLCMLLREPHFTLRGGSITEGWQWLQEFRKQACGKPRECQNCGALKWCTPCAGKNYLATGDPEVPSPQLCERSKAISKIMSR